MLVLGVDTSLPLLSVALVRDGDLLGGVTLLGQGSRNEKLLPAMDWLLSEAGLAPRDVDLFAVTRGPGSFTGVRIGLATVQGMALALERPVCAMSTHEALAPERGIITIADEAGRGEFYVSRFEDGVEIDRPYLAPHCDPTALRVAAVVQRENVAAACARRAERIAASGQLARYADVTPLYVRLAEAEVKLERQAADRKR